MQKSINFDCGAAKRQKIFFSSSDTVASSILISTKIHFFSTGGKHKQNSERKIVNPTQTQRRKNRFFGLGFLKSPEKDEKLVKSECKMVKTVEKAKKCVECVAWCDN